MHRRSRFLAAWLLLAAAAQAQTTQPETTAGEPEPPTEVTAEEVEATADEVVESEEAVEPLEVQAEQGNTPWYGSIAFGFSDSGYDEADLSMDLAGAGFTVPTSSLSTDGSDSGFKALAGYQISERIAVELGYTDLGVIASSIDFAGPVPVGFSSAVSDVHAYAGEGVTLAARGILHDGEKLDVSAKVGAFFWDAEVDVAIDGAPPARIDESGTDLHYGLGLHYDLDENWGLQLEVENYEIDSEDILYVSIGATYRVPM